MIRRLRIKGFRTLVDVEIPLSQLAVFIGPNNSGKTNVVRALQFLAGAIWTGQWPPLVSSEGILVQAECLFGDLPFEISLETPTQAEPAGTASVRVQAQGISWSPMFSAKSTEFSPLGSPVTTRILSTAPEFLRAALGSIAQVHASAKNCLTFFQYLRVASLSVPILRAPATISNAPKLGERGEEFAAVLDWIQGNSPVIEDQINRELKSVLGVERFTTRVTQDNKKVAAIIEGTRSFPAQDVSDGVLLYLGLTTAAHLTGPDSMLIVEEPENGIHPRRLGDLISLIRGISEGGTQVVLTTHSPLLLNAFTDEPDSVLVFGRTHEGTTIQTLSSMPHGVAALKDMSLGDLWYSGAIGGVPAA